MTAKEFVKDWLSKHLSPEAEAVTVEEQEHFENILCDVCEAFKKETIDKAWQYINEGNTFAALKNSFYKFMEEDV